MIIGIVQDFDSSHYNTLVQLELDYAVDWQNKAIQMTFVVLDLASRLDKHAQLLEEGSSTNVPSPS